MKKLLTFILTIAVMMTLVLPSQGFALENKELENAINKSKTLFSISDKYDDFNFGISKRGNLTVYNLNWMDTKNKLGNVGVTIDTTGRVLNYNCYRPYDSSQTLSKLPTVSKADALNTANAFILKVNPSTYGKIKYQDNNQIVNLGETNYYFNYVRIENDIPLYGNSINISVNNRTGEVQNYNCEWTDDITFPDSNGLITLDKAKQVYMDKLGLKLMYKLNYDQNTQKPYLVYSQVYNNRSIDAKTSEVVDLTPYYGGHMYDEKGMGAGQAKSDTKNMADLTPEEKKAVEKASNLINETKAEEAARKILNIDSSYVLSSNNLYNNYSNKGEYVWYMYFVKDNKDKTDRYYYASASIDASTCEVLSFDKTLPYNPEAVAKYNREQCINIAKELIKSLQPNKVDSVEFTEWDNNNIEPLQNGELPKNYYFTFTRKADGIYFPGNGFNMYIDATQGIVTSYNFNWYKGELPASTNVISASKAHESLFSNLGLELQYVVDYSKNINGKFSPIPLENEKPDIRLVYSIKPNKPINIDAMTGNLLDYSGKPYNETSLKEYTDINGCTGENEIRILAQYGITLPGKEFKPNNNITQRDFLYLLVKSVSPYVQYEVNTDSDEAFYNYLMNSKIIKEGEKNPSSAVTRQDASKFMIRALKYDRIADIKGIYTLTFKDKGEISPDLHGYMALAYGLNIIKDDNGYIKPTGYVTRAGAAIMIYSLLSIG